jgi:hypothetical protein
MDSNDVQIRPPKNWQTFEDLCLEIFRTVWKDPTAKKNGREGQPQHGTDVYGYPAGEDGALSGVQCKGKNANYGAAVTERELRKEIEKAKKFNPGLKSWILATTAPNNERIEEIARQITVEHQAAGLFKVEVFGWGDLETFIRKDQGVQLQFYPDLVPQLRNAAVRIAESLEKQNPDAKKAFELVREAGQKDLQKHLAFHEVRTAVHLGFRKNNEPLNRRSLIAELEEGKVFVVEAGPGAGKTTALLQLADQLQAETTAFIPIVIPLQDLGGAEFLNHAHGRSSFEGFGKAALVRLAEQGQIVLLCDGWNELSPQQRASVQENIRKFRRDFPKCGLLFATRAMTPAPLDDVTTLGLAVPSRAQQIAILRDQIGEQANEFWRKARAVPGLGDVLRTPLYLIVLASIGADGGIPETKDEAIRRFLEKQEKRHADKLREIFHGRQDAYLDAIALELTQANTTFIWDPDLRAVVARVSKELAAQGQIGDGKDPQPIIDALVAHHTLIESAEKQDGKTPYSFQHQQFQEWYASRYAENCIVAAHDNPTPDNKAALDAILNAVVWEEALTFAVERLSRKSDQGAAQCAGAILRSLAIDPMLGANLIRRAASALSNLIKEPAIRFAKAWHAGLAPDRAVRFMIGTGWPEFSEYVWAAYEDEYGRTRPTGLPRGWFSAESLGPDWQSRYLKLDAQRRRSLLFDLMYGGARSGVDFAIAVAAIDPDPSQVREVIEMLWDSGATSELNGIIEKVGQDIWKDLARYYPLDRSDGSFRDRLIEAKKSLSQGADNQQKLFALLELAEAEVVSEPDLVVDLALGYRTNIYQDQRSLFSRVNALYPEQLSAEALKRIGAGQAVPGSVNEFIRTQKDQSQLLSELLNGAAPQRREWSTIASALDEHSIEKLVHELLALHERAEAAPTPADKQSFCERSSAIEGVLREAPASRFVAGLLRVPISEPWAIEIGSELIFRWSGIDRSSLLVSADRESLDQLRVRIKEWVTAIIPHAAEDRSRLADVATAIKAVASIELLEPLKALLDADLVTYAAANEARGRGGPVPNGYGNIYRTAFAAMKGDAVRDVLLGYIGNARFEEDAAFQLVRFGVDGEPIEIQGQMGGPNYDQIPVARERRAKVKVPHPVAVNVLDRIEALIAGDQPHEIQRAITMAHAAVQMDVGPRMSTIRKVMDKAPAINQADFLHVALLLGEQVDPDLLSRGIEAALAEAEGRKWSWGEDQEWWRIERWLKLFAISSDPGRIVTYLARVPKNVGNPYQYDNIIIPLGYGDPTKALSVLQELSKLDRIAQRHDFVNALLHLGSKEAIDYLADLVLSDTEKEGFDYNSHTLSQQLVEFCRQYPELREKFISQAQREATGRSGMLLHDLIPLLLKPEEILPLIERAGANGESFAVQLAQEGVQNLAVVDRLVPGTTNVYEHEAQDLSGFRAELFRFYESDHPNAEIAGKFLTAIDRWRDSDGKPPSEPRHPDIASRKPWPREASVLIETS